jgi:UDPglucose 6-dehydrogenase
MQSNSINVSIIGTGYVVTEWPQYRDLPWEEFAREMRHPLVLDGRRFLDRARLIRAGFQYVGIVS